MTEIWHNPRCSKSRQTVALLETHGIKVKVRPYLKTPPTPEEMRSVLSALGLSASQIVRKGEKKFNEQGLKNADDETLISAMAEHPILIERPIVIHNGNARVGRPPEAVLELF